MGRPRTGGLGENAFLLVATPVPMQSGSHSLSWWRCRGVATFKGGVPMRMNSVRMLWGKGVRAGLYPLSDTEAYWFTTKNCSSVHSCLALASPVVILCFQSLSLKDGLRKGNRAWRTLPNAHLCYGLHLAWHACSRPALCAGVMKGLLCCHAAGAPGSEGPCCAGGTRHRPGGVQAGLPGDSAGLVVRNHRRHQEHPSGAHHAQQDC